MAVPVGGFLIEPNTQSLVVDVTTAGGARPTVYTTKAGSATHTLPVTISTRTQFWVDSRMTLTVSVKLNGIEIASQTGGTITVRVEPGTFMEFTPGPYDTIQEQVLSNAGYLTTAAANAAYVPLTSLKVVRKTADETVNNSTTLQDDDSLLFAIAANEIWVAEFNVFALGDATADIKFAVTTPAGATLMTAAFQPSNTTTAINSSVLVTASGTNLGGPGANANGMLYRVVVSVANGATAGNVTLQWAQTVQTVADTTVKAGSFLIARKVA